MAALRSVHQAIFRPILSAQNKKTHTQKKTQHSVFLTCLHFTHLPKAIISSSPYSPVMTTKMTSKKKKKNANPKENGADIRRVVVVGE